MSKTLAQKLSIRPGHVIRLINAPTDAAANLAPLPDGATIGDDADPADIVIGFVRDSQELAALQMQLRADEAGVLWIAYPKQASGIRSDLTRDAGWELLFAQNLRPVSQVAIDDTWTVLRWRRLENQAVDDPIAAQYAGPKSKLRPICDRLLALANRLGPDVSMSVRQSYIALARGRQFAVIAAPSRDRVELGLRLDDPPATARLSPAKDLGGGSISHKVTLHSEADLDDEVTALLEAAYRQGNG